LTKYDAAIVYNIDDNNKTASGKFIKYNIFAQLINFFSLSLP